MATAHANQGTVSLDVDFIIPQDAVINDLFGSGPDTGLYNAKITKIEPQAGKPSLQVFAVINDGPQKGKTVSAFVNLPNSTQDTDKQKTTASFVFRFVLGAIEASVAGVTRANIGAWIQGIKTKNGGKFPFGQLIGKNIPVFYVAGDDAHFGNTVWLDKTDAAAITLGTLDLTGRKGNKKDGAARGGATGDAQIMGMDGGQATGFDGGMSMDAGHVNGAGGAPAGSLF